MQTTNDYCFRIPVILLIISIFNSCKSDDERIVCNEPPCEPKDALQTMEIVDGFQVELFASEPLIRDPVAMEVDEQGRVYVVEDPGYPEDPDNRGTIRLLEDTNGDGYPDKSSIFADELRAPRGVMRWKKGILVTDAPDILYLEDTNGDGIADIRRVMMTGFGYGNPQLGVNTPLYGLDNWIYVAHRQGGSSPAFSEQPGRDEVAARANIRVRPDTYEWESLAASSQFGHTFDAFGRPLHVVNNNHILQEVIDARYLRRNPDLLVAPASTSISDHGTSSEVYPITKNRRYELFTDLGVFTAACGITCYLGGIFPSDYRASTFVAEPAHNLVHVDQLEENGTTLAARRMHDDREFLASTDRWFRPVNFYIGPDGALYVIDYYREVIEQPRFLSKKVLESDMLYDGADRGRIYRVIPNDAGNPSWLGQLNLLDAPVDELVTLLDHENSWWRRTAQRLLVDRQEASVIDLPGRVIESAGTPEGRVHVLWTLEGLGILSTAHIETALQDESPRVREQAIRLAELHLDTTPELAGLLMNMSEDPDLRVQFQLLCTLGDLESDEVRMIRQRMLHDNVEDEWMQLAALSAGDLNYRSLFEEALARFRQQQSEGRTLYFRRLGMLMGARQQTDEVAFLIQSIVDSDDRGTVWWQAASLEGLAEALQRRDIPGEGLNIISEPMARLSLHPSASSLRAAARKVMAVIGPPTGSEGEMVFRRAEEIAINRSENTDLRVDAIRLLDLSGSSRYSGILEDLVHSGEPGRVQAAAIRVLGNMEGAELGEMLLSRWNQMTPRVREAAIEAMLTDDERIRMLLAAVEDGQIQRSAVSLQQTRRLMLHSDEDLRLWARSLLGLPDEERPEVVERYQQALDIQGNAERGRLVFERSCAMCHQINGVDGTAFGPDLATARNTPAERLISKILMPNADISAGNEQWRVQRHNGEVVQGVITSETPGTVTFRNVAGQETTVPREDIQTMEAVNRSAMPTGLEQQISIEEMADLIEFLRSH